MIEKTIKFESNSEQILLSIYSNNENLRLNDDEIEKIFHKTLKSWITGTTKGREYLTIMINSEKGFNNLNTFDLLSIFCEDPQEYLKKDFIVSCFKNYKIRYEIKYIKNKIINSKNEKIIFNENEINIKTIYLNEEKTAYLIFIKSENGYELVSNIHSNLEDFNSTFNKYMSFITNLIEDMLYNNMDTNNPKIQQLIFKTYKRITSKKLKDVI